MSNPSPTKQRPTDIKIYLAIRRKVEFVLALILMIVLAPAFLIIMLIIRFDSPGNPLFRQRRIGKDNKRFDMYKFRSLYHDVDQSAHREFMQKYIHGQIDVQSVVIDQRHGTVKPHKDSQVTRFGRVLRKTSLDELPQLINILKGEMSFIGPRPNVPEEVAAYQEWHKQRLSVLPGITGWAQVNGRSSVSFEHIVKCDIEYVQKQSLKMDLKILWRTFLVALGGKGAS